MGFWPIRLRAMFRLAAACGHDGNPLTARCTWATPVAPDLIAAMDKPSRPELSQQFQRTWHPYIHQVKAWEALREDAPQSVVVSTGTGSGKTECFLVPILNDLVTQASVAHAPLLGVRALFLYPLNALINSQRDRLRAWTSRFAGKSPVRSLQWRHTELCPCGGSAPRSESALSQLLRTEPPPILVTNNVMLEFMLVRAQDTLASSRNRRGSCVGLCLMRGAHVRRFAGREISLLLRRVLHSFGGQVEDVGSLQRQQRSGMGRRRRRNWPATWRTLPASTPSESS
ncbi:MAG: DEAD/DEAH box helicase [Myxococcales bacterium]|nr:DEAD/DEAH box helicase [Myxococcales bacterium]